MSIFFDPRKRKPRMWTYFIFIGLTLAILAAFFLYGKQKDAERAKDEKILEAEPKF